MEINNHSVFNNMLLSGYLPGFISTLTFHQLSHTLLWHIGLIEFPPFSLESTQPFGVPAVLSLAFWGGIWGMLYKLVLSQFPKFKKHYLILAATLMPTLVFIIVVAPIKSIPFSIFTLKLISVAKLINLAWALGTAFFSQRLTNNRPRAVVQSQLR